MASQFRIISTLSPLNLSEEFLKYCLDNNQAFFRLNGSHLTDSKLEELIETVKKYFKDSPTSFILDLQGKKLRIGKLRDPIDLKSDQYVQIIYGTKPEKTAIPIPSISFFNSVNIGDIILLQDASIQLEIISKSDNSLNSRVIQAGTVRSDAGLNIKGRELLDQSYMQNIKSQINVAKKYNLDYLALSYITNATDLIDLRSHCQVSSYTPKIIAKIEHPKALDQLNDICHSADEIWYCRGDLGNFISPRQLSDWQKKIIETCHKYYRPIIIAGQVFQHLTEHDLPTRSEVVHFYDIIDRGVSGIVLSDETAMGLNPTNSLRQIISLIQ
jgi:pyruvate kinase